jgi:hypothetical protein
VPSLPSAPYFNLSFFVQLIALFLDTHCCIGFTGTIFCCVSLERSLPQPHAGNQVREQAAPVECQSFMALM